MEIYDPREKGCKPGWGSLEVFESTCSIGIFRKLVRMEKEADSHEVNIIFNRTPKILVS